ncbi:glycogen debranching protein GlgX [Albidovulum sediminicola]|uniref:Glycogen debranching protein GlgX n=1 Tax=Albidovulum sediminicola TaxID=2984331 RepID=A0ABT2YY22_9RHOB|nr:glycogen debranching protein GlgX [Defluviimonas sp. WL0075]MCV2863775.1 glycogen debranching protein GlgX [Defluviimonas sp. WL0075]
MTSTRPGVAPDRLSHRAVAGGRAWPLGATFDGAGVNFAVFSAHATKVEVCLFTHDGRREIARLALPERDGDIWHGHVEGLTPGTRYGLRVHGPYDPETGHRFNPNKLLIDPYARQIVGPLKWSDALMGYRVGASAADLSFDSRDSAFAMPKCVVADTSFDWGDDRPPRRDLRQTVIYEAHVRGQTMAHPGVDPGLRGTFLGMSSEPMIEHLTRLGVTAVELLPVQCFFNDRFLEARGLRNYWGYQTLGFFAPEPRYMSQGAVWEFQAMVRRFHAAGIEVLLDVVYNHSGEGDELGPTLCFRGIDNGSYYRLTGAGRHYLNYTGTGNTLNLDHPMVLRMVMDSLRYWVEVMHVDGFRFDLASALARGPSGFEPESAFLDALRQDPVLSRVKLIAEPWDIGPGGYRLGRFPHPFLEWNDRFRDDVRRYWRGDTYGAAHLARRLLGSAELFDHGGRPAVSSVNFVTCHDGFTLADLVSYAHKHNEANGEDNRDGHDANHSENFGVEGPSDDPGVKALRDLRRRNLLATLFLSQGTPMILAGDEAGNSQGGNNNAYAQDNPTGWVDWSGAEEEFADFVARLAALRREYPVLSQRRFLHGRRRTEGDPPDLEWRRADGAAPTDADWQSPDWKAFGLLIRESAETAVCRGDRDVFAFFNAGDEVALRLPDGAWRCRLDTRAPATAPGPSVSGQAVMAAQSIRVYVRDEDARLAARKAAAGTTE